ncbi:MAG: EAL domain-containing protein [Roseburia sp.]|nr:EAL domain-containing protein [Roseburia sp.]
MKKEMLSPLTGLYMEQTFFDKVEECLKSRTDSTNYMVAIDIEHFRLYNKLHGREAGDELLIRVADSLKEFQEQYGGVSGYLGGDSFGQLVVTEKDTLIRLCEDIQQAVKERTNSVGYLPAFGIYEIVDNNIPIATIYDRATVALSHVLGNYASRICDYNPAMDEKVEEELRILSEIQIGIDRDEFTFFVQPQCDITKGKIVGGESLVRWIHPEKGMIPPGVFIPILEQNGFIADLDRIVWKKVCQFQRQCIEKGYEPLPISINVSRIDIFSMNVPEYLFGLMEEYDLSPEYVKVEITESAYAESGDKIVQTVNELRNYGMIVMMDDFGSGYSSLNMLKSVPVDVLKMDMRFLEINERDAEKGIGILDSVINMAKQMRVPIVVEGVETQDQENHLLKMGCRYTQGYYYYKPMPTAAFEDLISDPRNVDYEGFWCRQTESIHIKEFLDTNLFNDVMANNILGPAAFYDMYENNIEITRVNEQYFRLAGVSQQEEDYHKRFWNHVRDDDRQVLVSIFEHAYNNPTNGATGFIHYLRADETVLWVYVRVFFLREKKGHKLFYGSLTDMTALEGRKYNEQSIEIEVEDLTESQRNHLEKYYGNLPCGYGIGKVVLDAEGKPCDYEIAYANNELARISGGSVERLRYMMNKIFKERSEEFLEKAYRAAYGGEQVEYRVYSNFTSRYLDITMYQYQHGYASCMMQDVTHSRIYEKALSNVMLSFREVYFLHMQENYCRQIYPDDNGLLERGNYEEVVNRHFSTGRILGYDEENVRKFLNLENLKRVLAKQDAVEYKYKRKIKPVGEEWCQTTITVSERLADGSPKIAIITIRSIEALMREREDHKRQNMAEMLATLSDGFFIYRATEDEKILYANPPVLKMFGCETMDEFRDLVNNSFQGLVYPEDLNRVQWEIHEQVKHSDTNMDYIRYRIMRKDGSIRWIDDIGHLEDSGSSDDTKLFYVFISDITDTITDIQKNKLMTQSKHFNEYDETKSRN